MAGNGKFYGTTFMGGNGDYGTIFSFDPTTNAQAKLFDFNYGVSGAYAHGSLVQAGNGKLYGMAQGGAAEDWVQFTHSTPVPIRLRSYLILMERMVVYLMAASFRLPMENFTG